MDAPTKMKNVRSLIILHSLERSQNISSIYIMYLYTLFTFTRFSGHCNHPAAGFSGNIEQPTFSVDSADFASTGLMTERVSE